MTHKSILLIVASIITVTAFCPQRHSVTHHSAHREGTDSFRQVNLAFLPSVTLVPNFRSKVKFMHSSFLKMVGDDDDDDDDDDDLDLGLDDDLDLGLDDDLDLDLDDDLFGANAGDDELGPDDDMLVASDEDEEDEEEDEEEEEDDEESVGKSDSNTPLTAGDYDAAVDINADIEIEEEDDDDDDDDDEFDLEGIDEEDDDLDEEDFGYDEEDDEPGEKLYEEPTLEQLEQAAADNAEEIALIDIDYLERKGLNEAIDADPTSKYELAGDYGGEQVDAGETSPWYMAEDEIDDGRQWNYTALMLSAIKRNPEMPIVRPDWFEKVRVELGMPDVDLNKEQYKINFSEQDVEGADTSLVEEFFSIRGRVIPEPDDVDSPNFEKSQEEREFFMARVKVHEEVGENEDIESLEARWQAWFEEVYQEEQLDEQFKLVNQDEENMREDYHWHERYRHLEERCFKPGLNAKLVIAVKGEREDLKKCEMVTQRMRAEFGDEIYVETQVFPEASDEDYLFEVWIVAYEDELLFSRRKHYYDQEWPGPDDFRAEDLEKLVEEVRFHLSDDAKNGFLFT